MSGFLSLVFSLVVPSLGRPEIDFHLERICQVKPCPRLDQGHKGLNQPGDGGEWGRFLALGVNGGGVKGRGEGGGGVRGVRGVRVKGGDTLFRWCKRKPQTKTT